MKANHNETLTKSSAIIVVFDTLIRSYLHLEPLVMGDDEWVMQVQLALWFESRVQYKQAQMLAKLFGE